MQIAFYEAFDKLVNKRTKEKMRHIGGRHRSGLNSAHLLDSARQFAVLSVIFHRRLPSSPFCYLVSPLLLPRLSVLGELQLTSVLLSVIDDTPPRSPSCTTPHPIQKKKKHGL